MRPWTQWILASALGVAVAAGLACGPAPGASGPEAAQPTAGAASPEGPAGGAQASALAAQTWLDDFTLGHQVDTEGAIPLAKQGDDFKPGQTVYVAMEVGDAPAGAAVQVVFEDASGKTVAEDEKRVPIGAKYLYFDSGDTSSWKNGEYRAVISAAGRRVNDQHFRVSEVGGAAK